MRRPLGVSVFVCALLTVGLAAGQPVVPRPVVRAVAVEQPQALSVFHAHLRALAAGNIGKVRVLHWGDSNVAAGLYTQVVRERLGASYGDGGDGYLVPPRHGTWNRGSVQVRAEGEWRSMRRGFARDFGPLDGLWGLAGVAVEPVTPGASVVLELPADPEARTLELHLLARPVPGSLRVRVDGADLDRVSTPVDGHPHLHRVRYRVAPGAHEVELRHAGGRPRLLGMVVEKDRGVTYDVLGINGHRASAILSWDESLLRAQLSNREPHLVVLSYGGNEALDPMLRLEAYDEQLRQAVTRVRSLAPSASCLLVGPLATCPEYAERMSQVTEIQRRAADELGCGFWDASQVSGGHGRLCGSWWRHGLVGRDRLHLAPEGYRTVGGAFSDAILP